VLLLLLLVLLAGVLVVLLPAAAYQSFAATLECAAAAAVALWRTGCGAGSALLGLHGAVLLAAARQACHGAHLHTVTRQVHTKQCVSTEGACVVGFQGQNLCMHVPQVSPNRRDPGTNDELPTHAALQPVRLACTSGLSLFDGGQGSQSNSTVQHNTLDWSVWLPPARRCTVVQAK
jgi:hypothetical protein